MTSVNIDTVQHGGVNCITTCLLYKSEFLAFHNFHFSVHFCGSSKTSLTKVMIAIQEDLTQNVLFGCEFLFFIYASPFTNFSVAERNNVYDVYVYCLGMGL